MIALQPDLEQVLELPVLGNVLRREVAMIIKYRFGFRELVIEPYGSRCLEKEVFVDEFHKGVLVISIEE
jgi:hypothetical protein